MTDIATILAALACVLILLEWTYVMLWTRRFGKTVVGSVLNRVNTLRTGRGKNPPAPQVLADAAGAPAGDIDLDNIDINSPIAQQFIERISTNLGVPKEVVEQYAATALAPSDSGETLKQGSMPSGSQEAPVSQGGIIPALLGNLLQGNLSLEDAAIAAAPHVLQGLSRGGNRSPDGAPAGSDYW